MRWADEQRQRTCCARTYMSAALALLALCAGSARADGMMDAWAQFTLAPKVWKGQTVPAAGPSPRPAAPMVAAPSLRWPAYVQLPVGCSQRRAAAALRGLDDAYDTLGSMGWPLPTGDGGYGSTAGFDVYLLDDACDACAAVDSELPWSDFDAAQTYALLNAALPVDELAACTLSAVAQAGLRAVDPSEAETWVRASGDFVAWIGTGQPGCAQSMVAAQRDPALGLLSDDPRSAGAGALFLAMQSERSAGPDAQGFVRALWETTRQRSHGLVSSDRLRGSPDLWEALAETLRARHVDWHDELVEFAVARYFAGTQARRTHASYRVLRTLPESAAVPLLDDVSREALPRRVRSQIELPTLGSQYMRIQTHDAAGQELRVWLKGELGPMWSLSAVRLAADGGELGRTTAPPRRVPNAYLPVTLDPETESVLLVIMNLEEATPDADRPGPVPHAYELMVALADP